LREDIPTVSKDTTLSDIFPIIHDSNSPVAVVENDRLVGVLVRGAVIAALAGESEVFVNG
ncbi:MAG: CBS domain-containing protein, partial [Trichococcus flocculiformis]